MATTETTKTVTRDRRPKPTILLVRYGHSLEIIPPVPELVTMGYTVRHPVESSAGLCRVRRLPCRLIIHRKSVFGEETMVGGAGSLPIISGVLRELGYHVEERNTKTEQLPPPRITQSSMGPRIDDSFLRLIRDCDRGIVSYDPKRVDPVRLIASAAHAWPDLSIVVAVTRVDDSYRIRRLLSRQLNTKVLVVNHRVQPADAARIVVGTFGSLGDGVGDLHNRDVIFALDPREMLANRYGRQTVINADQSRIFGFVPTGVQLTQYERDHLCLLFGTRRLEIPRHGQIMRPVHAVFHTIEGGPSLAGTGDICELLRAGLWTHPVRNRRVARLAREVAAGNDCGLPTALRNAKGFRSLRESQNKVRVGVLAANVEHALQLCRRLPGWRLVTDTQVHVGGLDADDLSLLKMAHRQPSRPGKGVIVTQAGLPRIRRLDVLIRADGGVGPLATSWAVAADADDSSRMPVLVIDCLDRHHPELKRRSRRRKQTYLDAGWQLPAELPTELDHFLATRPTFPNLQ